MHKNLIIVGASGHGKVVADIAEKSKVYDCVMFLDDDKAKKECGGFPVIGGMEQVYRWYENSDFFVAIGDNSVREQLYSELKKRGVPLAVLIHPTAVVGRNVRIGNGSVVMAGAVINSEVQIGEGCIINTCASIDHDCVLGNYVHVSVGAHLAGNVHIKDNTIIYAGATVINNIRIVGNCIIGAGAVIVENVSEMGTYVGVPAKKIK